MSGLFGIEPLMPAYGRDYETPEEAQADFSKNLDFRTPSGPYTNRADLAGMYPNLEKIRVRFNKLADTDYVLFKAELVPEPEPEPKPESKGGETVTWNGEEYDIPSDEQVEYWCFDGVVDAIDGCQVEPDGTCPHGAPSWLIQLGIM